MPDFTLDDVRALGAKLGGLALTDGEAAVLDTLFGQGGGAEVQGFASSSGRPPTCRDRMAHSFDLGFQVEIEGFTRPSKVAGGRTPGGGTDI